MRIAIVHPELKVRGGAERKILLYRQYLQSKGYTVDMYVFEYDKENTFHELIGDDQSIFILPIKKSYISKIVSWIKFGRSLRGYDHVVSSNYPTNIVGAFAKSSSNTISWICNEIAVQLIRRDSFVWNIYYKFEKWCNQKFDTIIVNSEATSKKFSSYYGWNATVVHSGVDPIAIDAITPEPRDEWEASKPFYLVLSRIEEHKNINFAFDLAKRIKKAGAPHKIIIAGTGTYKDVLEDKAGSLDNLDYVGSVSEAEKKYLYQNCEAFLFLPRDEPLGVTMMEALYQEKPVIAFNKGGPTEIVTKQELGKLCDNEEQYLDLIEFLSVNTPENTAINHGRKHICKHFSKDAMVSGFYKAAKLPENS